MLKNFSTICYVIFICSFTSIETSSVYFLQEEQHLFPHENTTLVCLIANASSNWRSSYRLIIEKVSGEELKNGAVDINDTNIGYGMSVTLNNVTMDDDGNYLCSLRNLNISSVVFATCEIIIKELPKNATVFFTLTHQHLHIRQNVTLNCMVSIENYPSWENDFYLEIESPTGRELKQNDRISVIQTEEFGMKVIISNLTQWDVGQYECILKFNKTHVEITRTKCFIHLEVFINIDTTCDSCSPTNISIPSGTDQINIMFHCTSYPPAEISWLKDGKMIKENNVILKSVNQIILNIQNRRTDGGVYTLVAQINENNKVLKVKKLLYYVEIRSIPEITVSKALETIPSNKQTKVYCYVYGHPEPNIMWFWRPFSECHSEIEIEKWHSMFNYKNSKKNSKIKSMISVVLNKNKVFRCQATNSEGLSNGYITLVKSDKNRPLAFDKNAEIVENFPVEFKFYANRCLYHLPISCYVRFGKDNINYLEIGNVPSESDFYAIYSKTEDSHVVTIKKKKASFHLHFFVCVATENKKVNENSDGFLELQIQAIGSSDPTFTLLLPEKTYFYTSPLNLTCQAVAKPSPEIFWLFDDKLLVTLTKEPQLSSDHKDHQLLEHHPSPGFSFSFFNSNTILEIRKLNESHDFHNISCVATNHETYITSSTILVKGTSSGIVKSSWFWWLLVPLILIFLAVLKYKLKSIFDERQRSNKINIGAEEDELM